MTVLIIAAAIAHYEQGSLSQAEARVNPSQKPRPIPNRLPDQGVSLAPERKAEEPVDVASTQQPTLPVDTPPASLTDLRSTRIALAKELAARTDPIFDVLWASGNYNTAESMSVRLLSDSRGRPLPNSGRLSINGFEYITLTEDVYPVEVGMIRTITDLDSEIKALELAAWND
ncbi:MAG: hypothetical protein P1V81_06855 [Planctomycetota bacterium]|nr:hypothetical protein [Planctomycetota bacterium]